MALLAGRALLLRGRAGRGPGHAGRRPSPRAAREVVGPYLAEVEYLQRKPDEVRRQIADCRPPRPGCARGWRSSWSAGHERRRSPAAPAARARGADIGLLLEGTYPFVSGGVSSWVHEIITGLPELTFGIVFIGSAPEDYKPIRYKLPPNLVHVETHYLSEQPTPRKSWGQQGGKKAARLRAAGASCTTSSASRAPTSPSRCARRWARSRPSDGIGWRDFLYSDETWHQICASYHKFCTSPSFVDYFWTVRTMHGPLFKMAEIAAAVPPFKVLHSVSTGYAGLPGVAAAAAARAAPSSSPNTASTPRNARSIWPTPTGSRTPGRSCRRGLDEDRTYVRRLWVRFFEDIGRLAYAGADPIISLYEGNRQRQVTDGAPQARTRVIPNGIDLGRFTPRPREQGRAAAAGASGLIGRVVPIKDIRGFIRAMRGGGGGAARRRGLDRRARGRGSRTTPGSATSWCAAWGWRGG